MAWIRAFNTILAMAWICRFLPQALAHLLRANESNGEEVGSGDATDNGGAIAGSGDVLTTDTGNEVCSSGPIHITEPGDKNKLEPDTGEAAEASDAQEATEEVHNTNQEQSESLGKLPEGLPLTSQKRRKRKATTQVPDSDIPQKTKKPTKWTDEESEKLKACKSKPSLPKGKQGWEEIANSIPGKTVTQCEDRWKYLQKIAKKTPTTTISSGPAANELNGASTSTLPVGKRNVPSSACPNLEVPHTASLSVEQMPAAVESEGWRQHEEVGIFIDNYLMLTKTKKQQRCEEVKPMLLNVWWLHFRYSFTGNHSRRLRSSSQG